MNWLKKILIWMTGLTVGLIVLLLLFIFLLPHLINLEMVQQNIVDRVSKEMGGRLKYQKVEILFFPRPYLAIRQADLSIPASIEGSLATLKVYPKIIPLFSGQVHLSELYIENPQLKFKLPSIAQKKIRKQPSLSPSDIRLAIGSALALPIFETPGLTVRIKDGQLAAPNSAGSEFVFQKINARIHRSIQKLYVKIICTSNIWEEISLAGEVFPRDLKAFGQVRLTQFHPHLLTDDLFGPSPVRLIDSSIDLNLNINTDGPGHLRAELDGTAPKFIIQKGNEKIVVRGKKLNAIVDMGHKMTLISLADMQLDSPRLAVSGKFLLDRLRPEVSLDLSAVGVDVDSLRKTALTLLGNYRAVRHIFNVINGGNVPNVTVNVRGKSMAVFSKIENFLIEGNIADGRIHIPGADLHVSRVKGEASIAGGILTGKNITAQMGNSFGDDGKLTLGLTNKSAPLHLEIETRADVAQLHPILLRLVSNETFRRELQNISEVSGNASGKLIIGDRLDAIHVAAVVSSANLHAEYARIPYPVIITGGRYHIDKRRCAIEGIDARIGQSSVHGLTIEYGWSQNTPLKVSGKNSEIALTELTAWLSKFEPFKSQMKPFQIQKGVATLDSFNFQGSINHQENWRYAASGKVKNLVLNSSLLAGSITVDQGLFEAASTGNLDTELKLAPFVLKWNKSNWQLDGNAKLSAAGVELNAAATVDRIEWDQLKKIFHLNNNQSQKAPQSRWSSPIEGVLRVKAAQFAIGDFTFKPVQAGIILKREEVAVKVSQADLCGISVPGSVKITPQTIALDLHPAAENQALNPAFTCLRNEKGVITGLYDLNGTLRIDMLDDSFTRSVNGHLELTARSGRIYRYGVLAKILALLNVTEVFRGKLPDVVHEGFAYESARFSGDFKDGKFFLKEGLINGSSMTVAYKGSFDLAHETMQLTVLVAPFKTFDAIIQNIPLVKDILGGQLLSIPFSVEGKWSDFKITPLSSSDIDTGVLGILNRSLQITTIPFQPLPLEDYNRYDPVHR
jgi:hypothetical protein